MEIISVLHFVLLPTTLVFGNMNLMKFPCIKDASLRQDSIFASFQTHCSQQCCRKCAHDRDCIAVNYNDQSRRCEMSSSTEQNGSTTDFSGWNVCFKTNVAASCIGSSCSCIGGSCFAAVTNKTSWEDASTNCILRYGGHLADIKSARIQSLLSTMFPYTGQEERVWIGGTDLAIEGVFKWSDGNVVSNGFQNWVPGQPFNSGGNEHCLIVRVHENYEWNDANCTISAMSICEFHVGN